MSENSLNCDFSQFIFQDDIDQSLDGNDITCSVDKKKYEHIGVKYLKVTPAKKVKKTHVYISNSIPQPMGLTERYNSPLTVEQPLRLLIVGHNPSEQSYSKGHFYANPSNRMWSLLTKSEIVPKHFTADNDSECPIQCGIGFTDLICGVSETKSNRFGDNEVRAHATSLYARVGAHIERAGVACGIDKSMCYPKIIAFSGLRQWKMLFPANCTVFCDSAVLNGNNSANTSTPITEFFGFSQSSASSRTTQCVNFSSGGSNSKYGVQQLRPPNWPSILRDSIVFLLPSSSGAAAMTTVERETPYLELGKLLSNYPWPLQDIVTANSDTTDCDTQS